MPGRRGVLGDQDAVAVDIVVADVDRIVVRQRRVGFPAASRSPSTTVWRFIASKALWDTTGGCVVFVLVGDGDAVAVAVVGIGDGVQLAPDGGDPVLPVVGDDVVLHALRCRAGAVAVYCCRSRMRLPTASWA